MKRWDSPAAAAALSLAAGQLAVQRALQSHPIRRLNVHSELGAGD